MNESNSTCLKALKSDDSDTYFYHWICSTTF